MSMPRHVSGSLRMMRLFFIILMSFVLALDANAKDFTRDYTYRASDDDSKNTARSNAMEQVKLLLLEEIGVYIQSYVETEKTSTNQNTSTFLSHEIKTTTAGITKTQILSEDWNGKEYKLSAKISIDVEDVIKKINDTIKIRTNSKNVAEYNQLLKQKDSEIASLDLFLQKTKLESKNQQHRLDGLNAELKQLKNKLQGQLQQEKLITTQLEKIKHRISKTSTKAKKFTPGMTESDLYKIGGKPLLSDTCSSKRYLNYGSYWAYLESGVFRKLVLVSQFRGPCLSY